MAIGRIQFDGTTAVLENNGQWRCDDREIEEYLNDEFALTGWWVSPAMGAPGAALLYEAAQALGGKSEYLQKIEPPKKGVVY